MIVEIIDYLWKVLNEYFKNVFKVEKKGILD